MRKFHEIQKNEVIFNGKPEILKIVKIGDISRFLPLLCQIMATKSIQSSKIPNFVHLAKFHKKTMESHCGHNDQVCIFAMFGGKVVFVAYSRKKRSFR